MILAASQTLLNSDVFQAIGAVGTILGAIVLLRKYLRVEEPQHEAEMRVADVTAAELMQRRYAQFLEDADRRVEQMRSEVDRAVRAASTAQEQASTAIDEANAAKLALAKEKEARAHEHAEHIREINERDELIAELTRRIDRLETELAAVSGHPARRATDPKP